MRFNAKMCYIMHITPKRNKQIHMYSLCAHMYSFSGQILDRVRNNPYLGLKIANDLKWNTNIKLTVSKVSITLGMLRRNLKIIPRDIKSTAYISMVRSILEYGSIVWDRIVIYSTTYNASKRSKGVPPVL